MNQDEFDEVFWCDIVENLIFLIEVVKENGVEFVYVLFLGLDIIFLSVKDVQFLKRKLEQVFYFIIMLIVLFELVCQ